MVRTEQFTQHLSSKIKCAEILGLMILTCRFEKIHFFSILLHKHKTMIQSSNNSEKAILLSILVKITCSGLKQPFFLQIYYLYSQFILHWNALGPGQCLFMVRYLSGRYLIS